MTKHLEDTNTEIAALMIDHYQKTYELTLEMWKYRNRTFLYLIGTIGLAALLTFPIQETQSLLVDAVANVFGITDPNRIGELRTSFPFELFQTILMVVIFYLMVNLYHRAQYVLKSYEYLSHLEREIRDRLQITQGIAFTREGEFYWQNRPLFLNLVKYVYSGVIGTLLAVFFWQKFTESAAPTIPLLSIANVILAIVSILFYVSYVLTSLGLDKPVQVKAKTPAP